MTLLVDIAQLCLCPPDAAPDDAGAVADAALVWDDGGTVVWAGRRLDLPAAFADATRRSAGGRLVVPGLVDGHTHLAFGGDRAGEFVERLRGTDYLEIARRGGGILHTVRATRAAGEDALYASARARLDTMRARGVTTVEAKSGYGLTVADELKLLRVYRRLAADGDRVVPTVLGAHTVPPEYADDRAGYVDLLIDALLPVVARERLAVFCDAFVEETAFTADEADRLFTAARALGLGVKLHADQLSDTGGAALAARHGAASADHLECVSDDGIRALAAAGTVAVSLPLATLVLGVAPLPARALLAAGVPVAVATDFNPGSAPVPDLPTALWAACLRQRMTPAEALRGATVVAARALGLAGVGTLVPGAAADLAVVDAPSLDAWMYHGPATPIFATVVAGRAAHGVALTN